MIYEVMISIGAASVFLAAVMSVFILSARIGQEENLKGLLRGQMEMALEQIKHDTHLSNGNGILFYPQNAASYTAVSLPLATPNGNGLLTFSNGAISWDHTVIYHLYNNNGKTELRRTLFNSYQSSSSTRQTQLNNVVTNGNGSAGPGSYTTTTLFSVDSGSMVISPQYATFDGYAPSTTQSENTSFGSVVLSSGNHNVSFIVTGKNGSSSGYKIGLDAIALSPSGGMREAEVLPISASSGKQAIMENMISYGAWGGNYQLEYQSSAVNDSISLQAYYDQWVESNFSSMTFSNTAVYGTDPYLSIATRESQSLTPGWRAVTQTADLSGGEDYTTDALNLQTIRCVVSGAQIKRSGNMMRIKFMAGQGGTLKINSAYFGVSAGSGNFASSPAPIQLYFDNAEVQEGGSDPVGSIANPGTNAGVSIQAGYHAWTNWFVYSVSTPAPNDFLVSYYVDKGSVAKAWTDSLNGIQAYIVNGNHAGDLILASPNTSSQIIGTEQIATWIATGTATSQVYDTKLTNPVFNQAVWTPTLPGGSIITMGVRSSDNADMSSATNWITATTSPGSLAGLAHKRYVQFQVTFQTASPYTNYPSLDNVKIDWPGATALVELSGVYTLRPNYGIFKVQVDGADPVKALELQLSASDILRGKTFSLTLESEEKPANTGK